MTSVGTEKAALKLLARARRTHSAILGAFVFIACVVQVPPLILFGVAVVSGWSEPAALYAGGAALAASLGANGLLVGLLRVTGRPRGDVVNFLLLAAVYVVLTAVAGTGAIGPVSYLGLQLVVVTVMNVVLVRRLGRPGLVIGERPVLFRLVGRTIGLMGGTELVAHAAPSILFVELAMTRPHRHPRRRCAGRRHRPRHHGPHPSHCPLRTSKTTLGRLMPRAGPRQWSR